MGIFILLPLVILPGFFVCYYLYRRFFEGNPVFMLWIGFLLFLSLIIFLFQKFKLDQKLILRTATYGYRFNAKRAELKLPLLTGAFIKDDNCWNTTIDSIQDTAHFVLIQKCMEENAEKNGLESESNILARALNDSTVQYLQTQYNFSTGYFWAELKTGNLKRTTYRINKVQLFEDCCARMLRKGQVDTLLSRY